MAAAHRTKWVWRSDLRCSGEWVISRVGVWARWTAELKVRSQLFCRFINMLLYEAGPNPVFLISFYTGNPMIFVICFLFKHVTWPPVLHCLSVTFVKESGPFVGPSLESSLHHAPTMSLAKVMGAKLRVWASTPGGGFSAQPAVVITEWFETDGRNFNSTPSCVLTARFLVTRM